MPTTVFALYSRIEEPQMCIRDSTNAAGFGPPQGLLATLAVVVLITTLLSGVNYATDFARAARGAASKTQ